MNMNKTESPSLIDKDAHLCHVKERYPFKKIIATYENGNHWTTICSDGTRVRENKNENEKKFTFDFAENADVKITNHCTAGCPFCHEGSSVSGKHADLDLPIFDTWKPGTEIAIGGGNVLDHPDLIPFLKKLKAHGAICNITVNQKAVKEQHWLLTKLIKEGLVNGIGISITNPEKKDEWQVVESVSKLSDNIVFHVIIGIVDETFLPYLKGRKVLFLGYKNNVGRGVDFNKEHKEEINKNIDWLASNLKALSLTIRVMSFDNLALAQLDARKNLNLTDEEWNLRFQGKDYGDPNGDDAPSTFYFDAVNKMIGRSSTQPYNERIPYVAQSFEEAFKDSLSNYTINEGEYGEIKTKEAV